MRRLLLSALLSGAFALPVAAQQSWVAIADDGRDLYGLGVGMATRGAAEGMAVGTCGVPCQVRLATVARCVAYARSDPGDASGYAAGADLDTTRQLAWEACNRRVPSNSCRIRAARCIE
ncbi:MAG: DUF4189 domain-containing protein [Reyranellaceae bacterium]